MGAVIAVAGAGEEAGGIWNIIGEIIAVQVVGIAVVVVIQPVGGDLSGIGPEIVHQVGMGDVGAAIDNGDHDSALFRFGNLPGPGELDGIEIPLFAGEGIVGHGSQGIIVPGFSEFDGRIPGQYFRHLLGRAAAGIPGIVQIVDAGAVADFRQDSAGCRGDRREGMNLQRLQGVFQAGEGGTAQGCAVGEGFPEGQGDHSGKGPFLDNTPLPGDERPARQKGDDGVKQNKTEPHAAVVHGGFPI
ncbi:MAG: hypothetical protein BWY77_01283 [bacterium ADurb.Bin431]|nr:MAG: hypothetical protein BWY77_01283 [bacterium ADurb.Bin431]